MSKRIVIAGCGLGGLTASYHLAKSGFDITIYEKCPREKLGFDWVDSIHRKVFADSGIPEPESDKLLEFSDIAYSNPRKSVRFTPVHKAKARLCYIDRIFLINYLIDLCEERGVKIKYETEVVSPIIENDTVKGITISENGEQKEIFADLVIDAGGMESPLRTALPDTMGVDKSIKAKDTFFVYRAYYKTSESKMNTPKYTCYFFHNKRNGMDWAITEGEYIDILVGGFGSLTEKQIEESVDDFAEEYPYMTDEIIHGGIFTKIPLRRMLSQFVANRYAAIGNSAAMTEPMSGSGITLSMLAGRILADTIINSNGKYDISSLWKYEYAYFMELGKKSLKNDILKGFLSKITADDIDYLMESGIMGAKEIAGLPDPYTAKDILKKVVAVLKYPRLIGLVTSLPKTFSAMKTSMSSIPEEYDRDKVEKWKKVYNKIG